jgi:hypothetical protein
LGLVCESLGLRAEAVAHYKEVLATGTNLGKVRDHLAAKIVSLEPREH